MHFLDYRLKRRFRMNDADVESERRTLVAVAIHSYGIGNAFPEFTNGFEERKQPVQTGERQCVIAAGLDKVQIVRLGGFCKAGQVRRELHQSLGELSLKFG